MRTNCRLGLQSKCLHGQHKIWFSGVIFTTLLCTVRRKSERLVYSAFLWECLRVKHVGREESMSVCCWLLLRNSEVLCSSDLTATYLLEMLQFTFDYMFWQGLFSALNNLWNPARMKCIDRSTHIYHIHHRFWGHTPVFRAGNVIL